MEIELWQYLKTANKPIVLYGMGNGADKIIKVLEDLGIEFKGVFASDGFVRDKLFHGHKISSYKDLKEKFGEMIVLLCFGSEREEVIANICKIAAEQELYAPEVPVIGDGLFTKAYVNSNLESFRWVYGHLGDEISRKTFENIIRYKLSGKIDYLLDCEVDKEEPYNSFLRLGQNESFFDLGAYTGDTVAEFIERVSAYKSITAVEPDLKSFKKLCLNTQNYSEINCVNAVISSFCGEGGFSMRGGRNSSADKEGKITDFITVDSLSLKTPPTFIKMDLEGEELNAIRGAKDTVKALKPKMLISCYHRTEDLVTIPKEVLSLRQDYKLYIRHFKALPCWDTNYYFV